MKKALHILVWVLLAGAVVLLPAFAARERAQLPCQGQVFSLDAGGQAALLSTRDLEDFLLHRFDTLQGRAATDIDPGAMEDWLKKHPYVLKAEAYMDMDRTLRLQVIQEQPLLRIFRASGASVYLSRSGRIMPLREGLALRIPILSGYLGELPVEGHSIDPQRHARLASAHRLGLLLEKDDFLRLLVSQIYIEPHGDLRMEPRIGKHSIIVGDSTGLESKLENLEAFYRQGLVRGPWDRYELINLKYKDQVVCTKRKTYEII